MSLSRHHTMSTLASAFGGLAVDPTALFATEHLIEVKAAPARWLDDIRCSVLATREIVHD